MSEPHPGLLTLWDKESEESVEIRWRVFSAAVSTRLDHTLLRTLPPHLLIPTAVLAYFNFELEEAPFENWELEALMTVAVIMKEFDADTLSKMPVANVHVRAVRIATLFLRGCTTMQLLLAACGFPVSIAEVKYTRIVIPFLMASTAFLTLSEFTGKLIFECGSLLYVLTIVPIHPDFSAFLEENLERTMLIARPSDICLYLPSALPGPVITKSAELPRSPCMIKTGPLLSLFDLDGMRCIFSTYPSSDSASWTSQGYPYFVIN
ncbi:hypothetical protein C0J52_11361 [Blattella germanica]|nr:hypothetical protein C0J52_11361 [Blattella germanica]